MRVIRLFIRVGYFGLAAILLAICTLGMNRIVPVEREALVLKPSVYGHRRVLKDFAKSCLSSERRNLLSKAVQDAALVHDVDDDLLYAMMFVESRCNPSARSNRGASGLMQLHPATAKMLGVRNSHNAGENISGGARYISTLLKQFNGDPVRALAAYNAGPGAVRKYGTIPPYQETRTYVKKVLFLYRMLQHANEYAKLAQTSKV